MPKFWPTVCSYFIGLYCTVITFAVVYQLTQHCMRANINKDRTWTKLTTDQNLLELAKHC